MDYVINVRILVINLICDPLQCPPLPLDLGAQLLKLGIEGIAFSHPSQLQ
jgi:hypothetical protein